MAMPVIETAGSPYDLGFQHGRQATEQVRATFHRFCNYEVGDAATREALTAVIEATVAKRWPEALEEMRGIAAGAGMRYAQIRDLNFSGELWRETLSAYPQGRLITPEEVAEMVYYLTNEEARAINGEGFRITMGSPW